MINKFNGNAPRDSGIIYRSVFEQIKMLYDEDPVQAGELAISAIEMVLTDEISSNDKFIKMILVPAQVVNDKNVVKRNEKIERVKEKKMIDNKLEQIAELLRQGHTQGQIGQLMGVSQQTISKRVSLIKSDYPELLQPKMVVESKDKEKMVVKNGDITTEWYKQF